MKSYSMCGLVALVMVLSGVVEVRGEVLTNVAVGAHYTLVPAPSYALCSDPGDGVQLTDGVYTEGDFWTTASTVGWGNTLTTMVTLDLGKDFPIRGASLNTAAGRAGVNWPAAIRIFVAGEDGQFRDGGDLLALSEQHGAPAGDVYGVHRYWTDALRTHGRYVAFVVTNQPYTFMDELEVYAGDPAWLDETKPGEAIPDLAVYVTNNQTRDGVSRRLRRDLATLREKAAMPDVPAMVREGVTAELDAIARDLAEIPQPEAGFKAVLPLGPLHRRIFACQASLWPRGGTRGGFHVWQSALWGPLSHLADPPIGARPELNVAMMGNEYRAASLNISNPGAADLTLEVAIDRLPGGMNPDYISVQEVAWTDTASGVPVASALPDAERRGAGWAIHVPSGMTRQVWFTFHPVDVPAGTYQGRVVISGGSELVAVPMNFHLYPMRFPDRPTLKFGGWDYTDVTRSRGVNENNRAAFVAHLKERMVNAPWATSQVVPRGVHDSDGKMTSPPDTRVFDDWITLWPDAAQYCVFAAIDGTFGAWAMGTPAFDTAVGDWARFWSAHAKAKGIDPARVCLLLYDEPHAPEQDAIIIAWASAIRASGAGLSVWEDPTYDKVSESQAAMAAQCQILCPNRPIFLAADEAYRDFYRAQRDAGRALEFYSCSGPSTLLDPYAYYRLQAWTCWKEGAVASYFWAFGDNADISSWNEYVSQRSIYTLSFLDDRSITAAKPMEAAREGVEDYEYFVMLREALKSAPAGPKADAARALLTELPEVVLSTGTSKSLMWHDEVDRSQADVARIRILEVLVALGAVDGDGAHKG
jgi:hypothetical protein